MKSVTKGGFTMPGEAGYEELTLQLAERWGADVIRDSDGTKLSPEILAAGYEIYSTICIIREHNEWAQAHPEARQQTFLVTPPSVATAAVPLTIDLMASFFADQFEIHYGPAAHSCWQVWDRTTGQLLTAADWSFDPARGAVTISAPEPFHSYTVSFLAYRIWEEINMYNHVTNHWQSEHLIPVDPRLPIARDYLYNYLKDWCEAHPETDVVRFTSLFYNFVWIWGSDERQRHLFTDWASYDFTVSEKALADFAEEYGYTLTAEDFVNAGNYHVTHMPPTRTQLDYMDFTQRFVLDFGRRLVALVQSYGKKAYVFYDDSWVGLEPSGPYFQDYGFDGLIKCVFSGFEVRLCNAAPVATHEIRLHPYLFPTGLNGKPTFMEGGDPTYDAKCYWRQVRRALLRAKIDRIGLGGYLHLVQDYPDFVDYIAEIAEEFRLLSEYHTAGEVYTLPLTVGVLHHWGNLRPWTLSGHFHESDKHDLIHINEALAGLPVSVKFLSFDQAKAGGLDGLDVLINAGNEGDAWSGGEVWNDPDLLTQITAWVHRGGCFLGVGEPTAARGHGNLFRLSDVLGIDLDTGAKTSHGKRSFDLTEVSGLWPAGAAISGKAELFLCAPDTQVLASSGGVPTVTRHDFGRGCGIYLSSFRENPANNRLLLNLLLLSQNLPLDHDYLSDNPLTECAWYPAKQALIVINNSPDPQTANIRTLGGLVRVKLSGFATEVVHLGESTCE